MQIGIYFYKYTCKLNLPNVSESMAAALEVSAVVLLQLADAALLRLHPAMRRGRRLLPRRRRRPGRRDAPRARATLTRVTRLPSSGRYAYLHGWWTTKTTLLPRTPGRGISSVSAASSALIWGCEGGVSCVLERPIGIVLLFDTGQRWLLAEGSRWAYYWLRNNCKQGNKSTEQTGPLRRSATCPLRP